MSEECWGFQSVVTRREGMLTLRGFALPADDDRAAQAWACLTGRSPNPRGLRSMFRDNEPAIHVAEVQRIIRAHLTFGGEDLVFWFDEQMLLVSITRGPASPTLWQSSPMATEAPTYAKTQRFTSN